MAKTADVSTKKLISVAPDNWVQWVTQMTGITVGEIVNSEFQWVSRESDVLIKAKTQQNQEFILLNEIQLRYKNTMPRRMRAYVGLAEEKFALPVFPVLINILNDGYEPIPDHYESNFQGVYARQDYRVINLWEVDVQVVFQQPIKSLLPFVPVLKDGGEESKIREALRLLRQDEKLNQFETVLGFFASFILDKALVQRILGWDMAILQESPWYKQIVTESEQRGEQRGQLLGELRAIQTTLEVKFGSPGLELMPQISKISDLERLSEILRSILTFNTLEEVQSLLQE
ncbi:MAG: transposase [Scytonematopsis contorta HA4267-MV1]|jgi:predicted transposase YdaD|nr:transposase [Scytonematopsis contorta HA4267-MV1]